MPTCTLAEVEKRVGGGEQLVIVDGGVYDIAEFMGVHPGGKQLLLKRLGHDIGDGMRGTGGGHEHSKAAWRILQQYKVAVLPGATPGDDQARKGSAGELRREGEFDIDFSKAIVGQVGKLGPRYDEWVHTPVSRKEPLRFFESNVLEFFSRTPWWVVVLIWIPFVCAAMYEAIKGAGLHPAAAVVMGVVGVCVWNVMEYTIHRFVFHSEPTSYWGTTIHFLLHGCHHKSPMDHMRLVFPPILSGIVIAAYFKIATLLLPWGPALAMWGGTLLGYVVYDCTHYYAHYGEMPQIGYYKRLKTTHMAHHYSDHDGAPPQPWRKCLACAGEVRWGKMLPHNGLRPPEVYSHAPPPG